MFRKMSLLKLPDDMIRYELIPFLNWSERINLNMVLPSAWRVSTKIKKKKILKHDCYAMAKEYSDKIQHFDSLVNADERSIKFKQIMDSLNTQRGLNFIKKTRDFHEACINKTLDYMDADVSRRQGCSESNAVLLATSCKDLYDKIINMKPGKMSVSCYRPISFV